MTPHTMTNYPLSTWLKLLLLALVWGSSFMLIKKGLLSYTPTEVAALRLAAAAAALAPFALWRLRTVKGKQWLVLLSVGMTGSLLPAFLFAFAQTQLDSGVTGTLNALTPLFTLIIGALLFSQWVSRRTIVGLGIGFAGTLLLVLVQGNGLVALNAYALFIVLATLCYGLNLNFIKNYLPNLSPVTITGVSLLMVLPVAVLYLAGPADVVNKLASGPQAWWSLLAVVTLGVIGTALALVLFNHLVQIASAIFASSVTYLIPIVAITLGVLDGELISIYQVAGMALILFGVWSANRQPCTPVAGANAATVSESLDDLEADEAR
ncbi:EamA family transporter [Aliidiomarina sedimenti]|uniref:EamA family transporter n=2 Tax=Aliidiomarina sedimenti TaxID=1933879 RepID=A0ABY0C0N0_9GAMM|nr:EamA family transporter [Aliidiomarina sedimenti]